MVNVLDDQVGEIMTKLKKLGLDENTLVIFTSDNGPHQEGGADPDYFDSNGPLRGYKRDLYEGGIRVPMIARWPGKIEAGSTTEHVSAFWDVMPTVAQLVDAPLPEDIDGISFLPMLTGEGTQPTHDYLYWEFHEKGGRMAVRKGKWKAVRYDVLENPDGPWNYTTCRRMWEKPTTSLPNTTPRNCAGDVPDLLSLDLPGFRNYFA